VRTGIIFLLLLALCGCAKEGRHFESDDAIKVWFGSHEDQMKSVVNTFIGNPGLERVELEHSESPTNAAVSSVQSSLKHLNLILVYASYDHSESPPALIKVSFLVERWGIAVSGGGVAITWFTDKAVGISRRVSCKELIPLASAGWYIDKISSESKCQR
jgi:hypothetical protein